MAGSGLADGKQRGHDPEGGPMFIREGIRSIEDLDLEADDARKIYFGNALKSLGI